MNRRGSLLAVIFAGGLLLRIVVLLLSPLTTDESFTWRVIQYPFSEMIRRVAEDGHAPVYFVALKAYSLLFGCSLVSLRCFSLLCYTLMVPASTLAIGRLNAVEWHHTTSKCNSKASEFNSAIWLVLLFAIVAVDPLQVIVATRARMYAIGMLIFAFSSWAYATALTSEGARAGIWWSAWGVLTGLGVGVHHFFGFAAAGQVLFAIIAVCILGVRQHYHRVVVQIVAIVVGCLVAIATYSPWIPVIDDQLAEVSTYFWIPQLTAAGVWAMWSCWISGLRGADSDGVLAFGGTALATYCLSCGVLRRPALAVPFACHAIVPWVMCVCISIFVGRSMLQERYLVFGQLSAIAALSVGWDSNKYAPWRFIIGGALISTHVLGCYNEHGIYGIESDSFEAAVQAVLQHDGDTSKIVFVPWPADVNRARYFLDHSGNSEWQVRVIVYPFRRGHVGHIAALRCDEVYFEPVGQLSEMTIGAWIIREGKDAAPAYRFGDVFVVSREMINDGSSQSFEVALLRSSSQ